jgi:hypothetical protein
MPCFSPTRGALSPLSSLRPFAFKVSALRRRSLSWPCKFIPSVSRLSGCSKWYVACLDGMHRHPVEGLAPAPSPRRTCRPRVCALGLHPPQRVGGAELAFPPAARRARSCRGGALPPVLGFKDVHQPRAGGERSGLRLLPSHELVTRLFLQHSEEKDDHRPCEGWRPTLATRRRPDC